MDFSQELLTTLSLIDWNVHTVIGFGLIGFALAANLLWQFFMDYLLVKWGTKKIARLGNYEEKTSTMLRKFFLPTLTRDPNEEFKPYLPILGPGTIAQASTFAVGIVIAGLSSAKVTTLGLFILAIVFYGCFVLARWQIRNNKW